MAQRWSWRSQTADKKDHVIKGSGDFMEENISSLFIPTLSKFIAISIVLMEI